MFGRDLTRVPTLFQQLANSPRLCGMVRKLEIRVYPIYMLVEEKVEMQRLAVKVLRQCVGLRELIWTRKGALTDA